jgi:hypothetical protein
MMDWPHQLAAAVIAQAWNDAASDTLVDKGGSARRPTRRDRAEAQRFLLDTSPGWSAARHFWATTTGSCPDMLRARALAHIPQILLPLDLRQPKGLCQ